jgi:hypothetical protein
LKLFTRVVIHRNWTEIESHELGEVYIDRLPGMIRHLLVNQNIGGDPLLIEIALWNERERKKGLA